MAYLLNVVTNATSSFLELHKVSIDNWVFKLYYKFTTSLLLVSSVLTTSKQLFGSPIQCDSGAVSWRFCRCFISYLYLGCRFCREGCSGVVLLDVLLLEHPAPVQGGLFQQSEGGQPQVGVQGVRGVQLLLPVGSTLPRIPRPAFLSAKTSVAHHGGRSHEVLWERNNVTEHWWSWREKGSSCHFLQQKYTKQVKCDESH